MKSNFLRSVNFKSGTITYNDFDIDPLTPFSEQKFSLKEDILQVDYGSYLIDLGWYPDCNVEGGFVIYLIHNFDWENYIQRVEAKNLVTLKKRLQEVVDYCEVLKTHTHA